MSFFQNATASHWYSSTNFALLPNGGLGNVGIGTATPSEKLQIVGGNVKIESGNLQIDNGKIITPQTGAFNIIPLCYGKVESLGNFTTIALTATPNVSAVRTGFGKYLINCPGITANSIISVTLINSTQFDPFHLTAKFVSDGVIEVLSFRIRDLIDNSQFYSPDVSGFFFVIYN